MVILKVTSLLRGYKRDTSFTFEKCYKYKIFYQEMNTKREMLKMSLSSSFHHPLFLKKIDFKKKVVSDVTSETTF